MLGVQVFSFHVLSISHVQTNTELIFNAENFLKEEGHHLLSYP